MSKRKGRSGAIVAQKAGPIVYGGANDAYASSIIGAGGPSNLPDLETYWMLYCRHPWVNQCVTLIADAVAAEGWEITTAQGDAQKPLSSEDDPRVGNIHEFMEMAFANLSDRSARLSVAVDMRTYGRAVWEILRVGATCVGLQRLDPRTVGINLNPQRTDILSYTIRTRDPIGSLGPMANVRTIMPANVILFTQGGGDTILGAGSPLEALDLTLSFDTAARQFREAYFRSGARAGTILVNKPNPDGSGAQAARAQVEAVEAMLKKGRTGAYNAHKTWILTGNWEVTQVADAGKNDADFVKAWGLTREDVFGVFKVPIGMLTFSGGALGSAGKIQDMAFFEEFCVLPLEESIYEILTRRILRDQFDIDDLRFAPKRRNRVKLDRFDAAALLVKFGGTVNEARELVGLPKIVDPQYPTDVPMLVGATGMGVVSDEVITQPSPSTTALPEGADPNAAAPAAAGATRRNDDKMVVKAEVRSKAAKTFRWAR